MMFKVVLLLALVAVAQAQRGAVRVATCTASGDPHFVTFDGVYHDVQNQGVFQAAAGDNVKVHFQTTPCNPPHAVTCVARVTVKSINPSNSADSVVVDWVSFPTASKNATIGGVSTPLTSLTTKQTLAGAATVIYAGGRLTVAGINNDWNVVIGAAYYAITFPYSAGFYGVSKGLCGFFDGNPASEFVYENGTNILPTSAAGQRYNNVNINNWGLSFTVGGRTGVIAPLSNKHLGAFNFQSKTFDLLDNVPDPVAPTPEQQAQLEQVPFTSLEAYNTAQTRCTENAVASTNLDIQNCVYDAAVLNDLVLAQSNEAAAATSAAAKAEAEGSSGNGIGAGGIAGIVLGCVAAVSLAVAIVLYYRLRKVSAAYSRALIVRSQPQDTNTPATALADNL